MLVCLSQVCASYDLERTLAEGAKVRDMQTLVAARGLTADEARTSTAMSGQNRGLAQGVHDPAAAERHQQQAGMDGAGPGTQLQVGYCSIY